MVKVLRTFRDGPSGRVVHPGDHVDPTPQRHEELAAGGLVEPPEEAAKSAQVPQNKMAEAPQNKVVTVTAPVSKPTKRGPGRPVSAKSGARR